MDVELAPRLAARPHPIAARLAAIPARYALAGMIALSFAVRWAAARGHNTLSYFTDEYIYPTLAHGIATTGRPTVRGADATFPALLEPLLTVPFWLPNDPELALRLTQGLHAFAISLAAIPVYLLARYLGLDRLFSLGAAAAALAAPTLVYATHALADPIGYPLALAAVYAGVRALDLPTPGAQLGFLALSGLATFARIQYAFLPLAFLVAAVVVERGRVLRVLSRLRLSLVVLGLPAILLATLEPRRLVGAYWHFPSDWYDPGPLLHWSATEAMLLAYGVGWVVVPGALVGLAYALARPLDRTERAFAALVSVVTAGLVLEGALIASIDSERFEERYLMAVAPLAVVAFGLYWRRGTRRLYVIGAIALGLLLLSARIPLSGYWVGHGLDDSPTLWAVASLGRALGTADASFLVALAAAALSLVAIGATLRLRAGGPLVVGLTLAVGAALSVGAHVQDANTSARVRSELLPADARWVDHAGLGSVSLLQTPGATIDGALEHLFWNRSVDEVLLLGSAQPIDSFAASWVEIAPDGRLTLDGRTLRRPLLVQAGAARLRFSGAELMERAKGFELWRPIGTPRLRLLVLGQYLDGWLGRSGAITVWPGTDGRTRGTLVLPLSLPRSADANTLRLRGPGFERAVRLEPGQKRLVTVHVDAHGPWTLRFQAAKTRFSGDLRPRSLRAGEPWFETRKLRGDPV